MSTVRGMVSALALEARQGYLGTLCTQKNCVGGVSGTAAAAGH